MLCSKCQKNTASHVYTQNINGKVYKYYLCDECIKNLTNLNFFLDDLVGQLIGSSNNLSNDYGSSDRCKKCKTSFDDIIKSGKVGCDECYNKFRDKLLPSIRKLHSTTKHIGNVPSSASSSISSKISVLKSQLDVAIKNQEFEIAAKLRDQINAIKKAGESDHE